MERSHPYVVFLPKDSKQRVLRAIFGSAVPVEILNFSIRQGLSEKIYQKDLIQKLGRSNKTIIDYLKRLTELGILTEHMEKEEYEGRKEGALEEWYKKNRNRVDGISIVKPIINEQQQQLVM